MKSFKIIGLVSLFLLLFNCKSKLPDNYHMDKKFWDIEDYNAAIRQIRYLTPEEEGLPRLSDPITAPVFMKLVDKQNVSIILEDDQLGLKHRSEVAEDYFYAAREIFELYQVLDIQDKYVYPVELVMVLEFNMHTQLLYFKLGNEDIIKDAVNPDDPDVKRVVRNNEQRIADNFNLDIEFLAREDALNDEAIKMYAEIINVYYQRLINEFPQASYFELKKTAKTINNKIKSDQLKKALEDLIKKIENK